MSVRDLLMAAASQAAGPPVAQWIARTLPASDQYAACAVSAGNFAIYGQIGPHTYYSSDGINWSAPGLGTLPDQMSGHMRYFPQTSQFAMLGGTGYGSSTSFYTAGSVPNNWQGQSCTTGMWQDIAYSGGRFVMVSANASMAQWSPALNGTWNLVASLPFTGRQAIAYGAGLFVAVGTTSPYCATSPDGVTWTSQTIPPGSYFDIVWNGSIFVATGHGITASSPDGINWTSRTPVLAAAQSITWGNGQFIIASRFAGSGDTAMDTMNSLDGITWTLNRGAFPSVQNITALAYGNGQFIASSMSPSTVAMMLPSP